MEKQEGIHFYINIENFNNVVVDEEVRQGKVNHSIHALDTFFSSIESFGKRQFSDNFIVEKITGSRLHMYILDDAVEAYKVVQEVVKYAGELKTYLNNYIAKYKTLLNFKIQVGACFGCFYNFEFKRNNVEEKTTIGYAANYAAKLQGLSSIDSIAISSNIFDSLEYDEKNLYKKCSSSKIKKYGEDYYYELTINKLSGKLDHKESLLESKNYANQINLSDMIFRKPIKAVSFDDLSKKECKEIEGIPLFADVRGFTSQFDNDDVNLEEMTIRTQNILTTMYNQIMDNKGIHVQFQGDREFALFHNYSGYECYLDAVKAGLKMIDAVKPYNVSIGVGQAFGKMFAAKIGARSEKDFIIVGSTVIQADKNEDENAKANQLVISDDIYEALEKINQKWTKIFKKADGYYYTTDGYKDLVSLMSQEQLMNNNKNNNYNGAWGEYVEGRV